MILETVITGVVLHFSLYIISDQIRSDQIRSDQIRSDQTNLYFKDSFTEPRISTIQKPNLKNLSYVAELTVDSKLKIKKGFEPTVDRGPYNAISDPKWDRGWKYTLYVIVNFDKFSCKCTTLQKCVLHLGS